MNYSSPSDINKEFSLAAEQKVRLSISRQIVYGILGGSFIAFGGLLALVVAGGMPSVLSSNPGLVKFVFGALFPVGLIAIVLGGAQLFTSDCSALPYAWLNNRVDLFTWLRTWGIIFISNFIGAILIAWLFAYQAELLTSNPWNSFLVNMAVAKTSAPFLKIFIKAIGANWLVCMAVWMSYAAKDVTGKIIAIWIPVMTFVTLGLEHSIANMFFIPAAMFTGADISIGSFLIKNLLPATLGNIVGGAVGVALPYWFMFSRTSTLTRIKVKSNSPSTISNYHPNLN